MSKDYDNYFKISKLTPRPLCLDETLKMIKKIDEIDVDDEELYEKSWIKTKLRKDIVIEDPKAQKIGKKKNGFFVISAVLTN